MLKVTNDHYRFADIGEVWEHDLETQVYVTDETGTTWRIERAYGGLKLTPIENDENMHRGMVSVLPVGMNCVRVKAVHNDNIADPKFTGETS